MRPLLGLSGFARWCRRGRRVSYTQLPPVRPLATPPSQPPIASPPPRGWRRYAARFRQQPSSYLVAFAILHEVTAIVPVVGIYWLLSTTDWRVDIPEEYWAGALERAERVARKLGLGQALSTDGSGSWTPIDPTAVVHLATAYGLTKLLLPLRILLSVALTPAFAKYAIQPVTRGFQSLRRQIRSGRT
ncbi:hypothetical protein IWQ61_000026 [Dispira simplex]|nr:hypothetical protein IWQ61_000026 [Dispira simplex]